jgi:hypothetical protein
VKTIQNLAGGNKDANYAFFTCAVIIINRQMVSHRLALLFLFFKGLFHVISYFSVHVQVQQAE